MPDEPSVGLEQVRMTPLAKSAPVPRGAGASPAALHDSGPTPASIARVSRDSITMRSEEARGGFFGVSPVHWTSPRKTSQETAHPPLLGSNLGNLSFPARNRLEMGFNWATEGNPIRAATAGKGFSQGMRARRRGLGRKTADQSLGQFPIARRSTRRYPPDASRPSTMARIRRRSSAVSKPQASITCLRSAGTTSDFARAIPPLPVFPGDLRAGSIPASATVPAPRAGFESPLPRQVRRGYQQRSAGRCRAGTVKLRPPHDD